MVSQPEFHGAFGAVVAMLQASYGLEPSATALEALKKTAPERLVETASSHMILPQLGLASQQSPAIENTIPEDLSIFLTEMLKANERRNSTMREQVVTVGDLLAEHKLEAVILKGGVDLLGCPEPARGSRVVSDIDLLVAEKDLSLVQELFVQAGWHAPEVSDLNQRSHHHLPSLARPDWPAPVEIHRRITADETANPLPTPDLLRQSHASAIQGLRAPHVTHRLVHLIMHGPLSDPRFSQQRLSLRDVSDLFLMSKRLTDEDWRQASEILRFTPSGREALAGLAAAAEMILPGSDCANWTTPAGESWAKAMIGASANPAKSRAKQNLDWIVWYLRSVITDPERRRHYLGKLGSKGGLSALIQFHRDRNRRIR